MKKLFDIFRLIVALPILIAIYIVLYTVAFALIATMIIPVVLVKIILFNNPIYDGSDLKVSLGKVVTE